MDYDARFKLLLTLFFQEFVELFLPDFAQRVDWRRKVEFLDKELRGVLPQQQPGTVDLLVKVVSKKPSGRGPGERLCLIHVEIESRKSRRAMGERMLDYFHRIHRKFNLPVVPSVLYVRVGGEGLGWQNLDLYALEHRFCHFEFPYIGLPDLDGQQYLAQANPLAWALTGLMSVPETERARIKAESLRRAASARLDAPRRQALIECVESFTDLDEIQQQEFEGLLKLPAYEEIQVMQKTTFEKGRDEGVQGTEYKWLVMLLQEKFGDLPERIRKRIAQMTSDEREQVARQLISAQRLKDLPL